MREWMASDLSKLDLLVVQIDGIHMTGELLLVAAIGIDGVKHPLGLIEDATENATVLIARGLDPAVLRLFIIDGSKALSKAIRRSFGREALFQRARIIKLATSWSGCRSRCMPLFAACCDKLGSWTKPRRIHDEYRLQLERDCYRGSLDHAGRLQLGRPLSLDRLERRSLARRPAAVGHRAAVCVPSLRPARCRRETGFQLGQAYHSFGETGDDQGLGPAYRDDSVILRG
jgi:hypothetical protein